MKYILVLALLGLFAFEATSQIKGQVKDPQTGETLIGANVVIKGTTTGAITDLDGNFEIKTDLQPPVTLVISFLGYEKQEVVVEDFSSPVKVKLSPNNVMLDAVEIVDTRISDKQKQAPLTVESMDVLAIKEAPSGNFYEGLANMKGVDMTSASLGFKVINTRGFNSTSPVRSLQLIDGVDNQSPGLNFSLGNFLGASDLDVMKVDVIAGASSAFYGPGAFNGVINMTTKDPFLFKGLSASAKWGERNLQEYAVRWADAFKNKDGEEKFGYKLNLFYMEALDWEAENYDPVDDTELGRDNPGRYDAVNVYGDEGTEATNNDFTNPGGYLSRPGLGAFRRSGYREVDLADYNTDNLKLNAALHYKIINDVEIIAASSYSTGTTIYQGENRFSLKDIQFWQNRLEVREKDKWFVRAYATNEDAGNSYDIVTTALRLQDAAMDEASWNTNYFTNFQLLYSPRVRGLPGYPALSDYDDVQDWAANGYEPWVMGFQDTLSKLHEENMWRVDTNPVASLGDPKYLPGTQRFDSLFADVTTRTLGAQGGSRFYDRSALYHIQGEYKFENIGGEENPWINEIIVGGNWRLYTPDSRGTIFSDTLQYERLNTDTGVVFTDSSYRQITNRQYGVYFGLKKTFMEDKLTTTFTLRMDKNENFDYLFSPALSFVYTPNNKHTIRTTFTSGNRNPTLADQYLFYDVGRATLLGNLNGFDSLVTRESLENYLNSFNRDTLEYYNVDPIRPERVQTVEIGYRGFFWDKLYLDVSAYHSWYQDFIGFQIGIDTDFDQLGNVKDIEAYRIAANAISQVTTRGVSAGVNYYLNKKLTVSGNYSFNELTSGEDDPLIPAFNTPRNKYNLGLTGREISIPYLTLGFFGFGINYKWIEGFRFEGSPQFTGNIASYDLMDAQINYSIPKWNLTFKLGASNILNNQVFQVYGGPRVGRLAYFSILFDWRKQ